MEKIVLSLENERALNEDFNLSTAYGHTVLELAEVIWRKILGDEPFEYVTEAGFEHDVQKRIPSVVKAKEILGFEANTSLDAMLDELIPRSRTAIVDGVI
jgi:UDP-glucose 4-epimerase